MEKLTIPESNLCLPFSRYTIQSYSSDYLFNELFIPRCFDLMDRRSFIDCVNLQYITFYGKNNTSGNSIALLRDHALDGGFLLTDRSYVLGKYWDLPKLAEGEEACLSFLMKYLNLFVTNNFIIVNPTDSIRLLLEATK